MGNAIGWCSATLNPVVGCYGPGGTEAKPNRCPWCYAARQAPRVAAMIAARFGRPVCQDCGDFKPHFHPERLDQIGKGRGNLFVGSMTDLWGEGVLTAWRDMIWGRVWDTDRPVTVLTKLPDNINPGEILDDGEWPPNLWVGASITGDESAWGRMVHLGQRVPAQRAVLSVEPLMSPVADLLWQHAPIAWLIVGPQSGPGAKPPLRSWVDDLVRYADETGTPLWLKDGCYKLWPDLPRRQEWPEGMVG